MSDILPPQKQTPHRVRGLLFAFTAFYVFKTSQ